MKNRSLKTATALIAAFAAIILCLIIPGIFEAKASAEYTVRLNRGLITDITGTALVRDGDTRLTYITMPTNRDYELLCSYIAYDPAGNYSPQLFADTAGTFYPGIKTYTNENGEFLTQKTSDIIELETLWYKYTSDAAGSSLKIDDPSSMWPPSQISYNWYDSAGNPTGETGSISKTPDAYCTVRLSGFAEFRLPEIAAYTITYETNGGRQIGGADSYDGSETVVLPVDVTRVGYDFEGWYDNEELSGDPVGEINQGSTGNKTFYAKWTACVYAVTLYSGGDSPEKLSYTYGVGISLPEPERTGHSFDGWYESGDLSGETVAEIAADSVGDKVFYAKWTALTYSVTYKGGGNINSGGVSEYTYGDSVALPVDVTCVGYDFGGWYDNKELSGDPVSEIERGSTGNKTFYAKWTARVYAVTLYSGGDSPEKLSYTYGVGISLPAPEKTGHSFDGWYESGDFSGEPVAEIAADAVGDKVFYAKWTALTYSVTYKGGGNINSGGVSEYTYGNSVALPTDVTRAGYEFTGWYTEPDCGGRAVTGILPTDFGNKTFYAGWRLVGYTITYVTGGGTINEPYESAYEFGVATVLPQNVEKRGYTFAGWFEKEDFSGGAVTVISDSEYGDRIFYAKWTVNTYSISYDCAGGSINGVHASEYTYGIGAALPADVTRTGYEFAGWYTGPNKSGQRVTGILPTDAENMALCAGWNIIEYSVTYDTGGGSITSEYYSAYTFENSIVLPTAEREGYVFGGWYDNKDCLGEAVTGIKAGSIGDKIFYAKWTAAVYTISYDCAGGSINGVHASEYIYGIGAALPADVTRTGYEFAGWYNQSGQRVTGISPTDNGNKTLYARWNIIEYSIKYETGGGRITSEYSVTYTCEDIIILPSVEREGYVFGGWYQDKDCKGEAVTGIKKGSVGDRIFYAKWTAAVYTISYDCAGGSINGGYLSEYIYGTGAALPTDVTRLGYEFAGWYTGPNKSGQRVTGIFSTDTGNKTLYAGWNIIEYSIKYETGGGNITSDYSVAYTCEDSIILPSVEREGYVFGGWYEGKDCKGEAVTVISAGSVGDRIFYAKWTAAVYTISYDCAGGIINSGYVSEYTYGTGAALPTDVKRAGYEFAGWYNQSGQRVTGISLIDTGNKTLYARWNIIEYSIKYETGGGKITSSYSAAYTCEDSITLPSAEREGYVFGGWYEDKDCSGEAVSRIPAGSVGDKVFYAKWTAAVYTISYDCAGGVINGAYATEYTYGVGAVLPNGVTRAGYEFLGWYADIDGTGERITAISSVATGAHKYYARWKIIAASSEAQGCDKTYDGGAHALVFSVSAAGEITYQWYRDGKAVSGGTSNTLYVTNVADSGSYYCVASVTASGASALVITGNTVTVKISPKALSAPTVTFDAVRMTFTAGAENADGIEILTGDGYVSLSPDFVPGAAGIYYFRAVGSGNYTNSDPAAVTLVSVEVTAAAGASVSVRLNGQEIGRLVAAGSLLTVTVTVEDSYSDSISSLIVTANSEALHGSLSGVAATYQLNAITDTVLSLSGLKLRTYDIILVQGVGYTLTASALTAEHGSSCVISYKNTEGYSGGSVYINGLQYDGSGGSVTVKNITGTLTVTFSGVSISSKYIFTTSSTGTYNGEEIAATALVNLTEGEFIFSWYLDGRLVYQSVGRNSVFGLIDAGTYELVIVITAAGDTSVSGTATTTVTINKAATAQPSAVFDAQAGVIYLSAGVRGYEYMTGGVWTAVTGDTFTVLSSGTYVFRASGDGNHLSSAELYVIIFSVTFTSGGITLKSVLAESGCFVDPGLSPEKETNGNVIYKFNGWVEGGIKWDGRANGNITLSAVFDEYLKTVDGAGGLSVASEEGLPGDTVIIATETSAEFVAALEESGSGLLLHAVDISVSSVTENSEGTYTVTYPLPAGLWGKNLAVYHYTQGGTVERVSSFVSGGNIVFVTTGFSPFGFFDVAQYTVRGVDTDGNLYYLGSYTCGTSVKFSAVAHPAAEGYTYVFGGWFTDAGLTLPAGSVTVTGDTLLYAKFTAIAAVFSYNVVALDSDGNMYYLGLYAAGSEIDLSLFTLVRGGDGKTYIFEGLYTSFDFTTAVTNVVITGDVTVYAKFSVSEPEIPGVPDETERFSLTGVYGGVSYGLGSYEGGTVVPLKLFSLPSLTVDGTLYVFEGWYADEAFTVKSDSAVIDRDTVVYARYVPVPVSSIVETGSAGVPWSVVIAMGGVISALLAALIIAVVIAAHKPAQSPAHISDERKRVSAQNRLGLIERRYEKLKSELESAENYLQLCPDDKKYRAAAKAKERLREYENIMLSIESAPAGDTARAGESLDRLAYELQALFNEIYR